MASKSLLVPILILITASLATECLSFLWQSESVGELKIDQYRIQKSWHERRAVSFSFSRSTLHMRARTSERPYINPLSAVSRNARVSTASPRSRARHVPFAIANRREALERALFHCVAPILFVAGIPADEVVAYTPDADKLRESLYMISRVQEATVQQERYLQNKTPPIQKMKLTLRLVERSYRLLDQITYVSTFLPADALVPATEVGNEAVDELQTAIDFVYGFKDGGVMTAEQKDYVTLSLRETREKLFTFLDYLPNQMKLDEARLRVEEENKMNMEEFDGDADAGVYNPVVLPWKTRQKER